MEILHDRCCGLDVHKSSITACVLFEQKHKPQRHLERFGCTTRDLLELVSWLKGFGVRHVAMESTGVYWKPVWNVLEEHFQMLLANAQHIKTVPGRKTDMKDCQWIAELLRHGLLRGSYVPSLVIRDLRDLTRTRATLSQEQSSVGSRIQKVLESANIKLSSTASNTMGKSGRAMLDAIVSGEESPERLADLALGKLRSKISELQLAWEGRIRDHHRFLLDSLLRQFRFLGAEIKALDLRLERLGEQHKELADAVARWITVPGLERVAAWAFVAEIGFDMAPFPTAAHLASWAGVCPGNHESAGKRLSGKSRKGSPWLRRMACQSAWAAARTKNCYLSAQFKRLAARRGSKRAIIAVAHSLLVIGYHIQKNCRVYQELGGNYFDHLHAEGLKRHLVKRLESLGLTVTLEPHTA
ncbi:MAG: IS110 family transposase [Alloacidobacterium sp.]